MLRRMLYQLWKCWELNNAGFKIKDLAGLLQNQNNRLLKYG